MSVALAVPLLPARLRRPQDPPSSRFHVQKMVARMRGPGSATSHPRPMDPGTESVKCEMQPRYHCVHPPSRCGLEPAARFAMSQLLPVARAFSSASFSYCAGSLLAITNDTQAWPSDQEGLATRGAEL